MLRFAVKAIEQFPSGVGHHGLGIIGTGEFANGLQRLEPHDRDKFGRILGQFALHPFNSLKPGNVLRLNGRNDLGAQQLLVIRRVVFPLRPSMSDAANHFVFSPAIESRFSLSEVFT